MYNHMKKADNFNPAKWLVENKLTSQSKENENQKEIDFDTLEIDYDDDDYPDFSDAYVSYAEYTDGTPLTDKELDDFNNEYGYEIAQERALKNY